MFHRRAHVTAGLFLAALLLSRGSAWLVAQAAPREFFVVCMGQAPAAAPGGMVTFYFSGVLQGPATALQAFRTGFTQFLTQRYAFKGLATCSPTNTEANAQSFLTQRATALKNNTRVSVIETGWTESADVAAAPAAATNATGPASRGNSNGAAAPVTGAANAATSKNAAAGGTGNTSTGGRAQPEAAAGGKNDTATEVASVVGTIFGTNNGGNASENGKGTGGGSGAGTVAGSREGQNASGRGSTAGGTGAGAGSSQSPAAPLSGTLASVFSSKTSSSSARGGQPGAAVNSPNALPNSALGSAQSGTTKLVVYGCGRQAEQIACVSDLTNQNARDSLVQSADVWKDAFLVDDRGDRHQRTNGFFLNIDGEQRQQLDIAIGKTAKFILMFDNVQTRVLKVSLRAPSGGLDVEDIGLVSTDGANTPSAPQR